MSASKVLLVSYVLIRGDEDIVAFMPGNIDQISIAKAGPISLRNGVHQMSRELLPERHGSTLVEQDFHDCVGVLRPFASCSRTALTFHSSTPWNQSRNCPVVAPQPRFLSSAHMGTLVPAKTQAPLSLSGCRSSAGHVSQFVIGLPCFNRVSSECHGPARIELKPLIESPNVFAADQIDCVDRLQFFRHGSHQFGVDALPLPLRQHFKIRDMGTGNTVSDGSDEPNHSAVLRPQ